MHPERETLPVDGRLAASLMIAVVLCQSAVGQPSAHVAAGAEWELRMLGVDSEDKLSRLRAFPRRRVVRLAVVGQGGVSAGHLQPLGDLSKVTYHGCADPGTNTHDTQAARVILDLTSPLGVEVELHVWQPGSSFREVADRFRDAAAEVDIVAFFQSFWGPDAKHIEQAIRDSPSALFVSPYVEVGDRSTGTTPQGAAFKPWVPGSIGHFVTVVPLARRGDGRILTPLDRGLTDSEAINFIAPSYHASGPGGTCPAAEVAAACAAYVHATMPERPEPAEVIDVLRAGVTVDRRLLAAGAFDDAAVDNLEEGIQRLSRPLKGKQRKLDAPGVLNLYKTYRRIRFGAAEAQQDRR